MNSKTLLYLIVFIVLGSIAYFVTREPGEKTTSYKIGDKAFFDIDSASVDRLEIKTKDGNLVLIKADGKWTITEPFKYKTVSALVENAISNLKEMKISSLVSSNPEKHDAFGFHEGESALITVFQNGKKVGTMLLGNPAASNSSYVKRVDSDEIYIADNMDRFNFVKPTLNDWRDKIIISIPKESVQSVDFNTTMDKYTVAKDESGIFRIGSDSVGKTFDAMLSIFNKMEATEFKDTVLSAETNFNEIIKVNWDGKSTEFKFLKTEAVPPKYLMQIPGDPQIYQFEDGYLTNLVKKKSEMIGK